MLKLTTCGAVLCLATLATTPAGAQTDPVGWSATANLSGVATEGNTSTSSFGGKLRLERNWLRTSFFVDGGGITQSADEGTRFAVGTPASFTVTDETERVKKAENFFANLGFERRMTEQLFWTVGGGWKRDLFSGVESQLSVRGGVGYVRTHADSELKLGIEATFTDEQDVVEDPERENPFFGGRGSAEWLKKFGEGGRSQFQTRAAIDQSFQTSDDTRLHWDNALTVSMTERLALQLGYVLDWRNRPALEEIPLFPGRPAPGDPEIAQVTAPLEKLDHVLQVSLVIQWSPRPPSVAKPTR